jgi:hypothetical protein
MKTRIFHLLALVTFAWLTGQSNAATIPAGATLVVQTLQPISSVDAPGKPFRAQLAIPITANGKVVLPVGTELSGKVVTSRRLASSSQRLTVNLTEIQFGGRAVPIKTTGAILLENNSFKTRSGVPVSRAGYQVASGRKMEFRLAEPVNL